MHQKILWFAAAALLAGLGFWLELMMPTQGWAQGDGAHWHIVAEGWAVLWRGWPLVVLGALVGAAAAGIGLALTLKHAQEADFRAEIGYVQDTCKKLSLCLLKMERCVRWPPRSEFRKTFILLNHRSVC